MQRYNIVNGQTLAVKPEETIYANPKSPFKNGLIGGALGLGLGLLAGDPLMGLTDAGLFGAIGAKGASDYNKQYNNFKQQGAQFVNYLPEEVRPLYNSATSYEQRADIIKNQTPYVQGMYSNNDFNNQYGSVLNKPLSLYGDPDQSAKITSDLAKNSAELSKIGTIDDYKKARYANQEPQYNTNPVKPTVQVNKPINPSVIAPLAVSNQGGTLTGGVNQEEVQQGSLNPFKMMAAGNLYTTASKDGFADNPRFSPTARNSLASAVKTETLLPGEKREQDLKNKNQELKNTNQALVNTHQQQENVYYPKVQNYNLNKPYYNPKSGELTDYQKWQIENGQNPTVTTYQRDQNGNVITSTSQKVVPPKTETLPSAPKTKPNLVKVVSPDGQVGTMPREKLGEARKRGFTIQYNVGDVYNVNGTKYKYGNDKKWHKI